MSSYSADQEFFGNYFKIRDELKRIGWKELKPLRDRDKVCTLFTKDGYAVYVMYGCEEDIKNELL